MKTKIKLIPYISIDEINKTVSNLARVINQSRLKNLVVVSILDGSFMFTADLIRQLNYMAELDFIKFRSYCGIERDTLIMERGLTVDVKDRNVLIVEDIIDTGQTVSKAYSYIKTFNPHQVSTCTLLYKPSKAKFDADYIGIGIANVFVVGYGLDFNDTCRNLPDIRKLLIRAEEVELCPNKNR